MKLSRKHRILTTLVALFGMLFMQLAVASYHCPALQPPTATAQGITLPDCHQPQAANAALCHAHCHDSQPSPDKTEMPAVSPAALIGSVLASAIEPVEPGPSPAVEPASMLQRSTAPPLAIRHCCLRI
jgi:hypothetical protein